MRVIALALVVCIGGLVAVSSTQIRGEVGVIAGTVKDAAGNPLPGAALVLTASSGALVQTGVTDANGAFRFNPVSAGEYSLIVALAGFQRQTRKVVVGSAALAPLSVVLAPDGARQEALVSKDMQIRVGGNVPGQTAMSRSAMPILPAPPPIGYPRPDFNTESYSRIDDNPFRFVSHEPLSTFSIDVDTASYSNVRRFLTEGRLPPQDAVRAEEMINYFRFDYPAPPSGEPFSVTTELAACPWNSQHRLALVGLRARPVDPGDSRGRNLVFLIDVSGSMMPLNKLPLVRTAMRMLTDTLTDRDRIAIVVYAGASGLVLPSTSGAHKERIHTAIAALEAGGSTNGGAGITLAYQTARDNFIKGGINRVILATDGDFNVGVTSEGELTRLIEDQRKSGVFLSVLGVGTGNLKDSTMEKLADKGNGNYAYLDTLHEARKVLVAEAGGTLMTVAKDVKIQIEFNAAHVAAYRLIGYENRLLNKEDFNDDRKDAGEIGAGHTVTALYELVPPGVTLDLPSVDPLKYQKPATPSGSGANEVMTVKLRYKQPDGDTSQLIARTVANRTGALGSNAGFAAAVAEFAMLLRRSPHKGHATFEDAAALAKKFRGEDPEGYRAEFVRLVDLASALARQTAR